MSYSLIVYVVLIGGLLGGSAKGQDDPYQHAVELLSKYPLIDGYYVSRAVLCNHQTLWFTLYLKNSISIIPNCPTIN